MTTPDRHASLPFADYDHLPVRSVTSGIEWLDLEQLEQLLGYERNHAERTDVLELIEHRLDELKHGAQPRSDGTIE